MYDAFRAGPTILAGWGHKPDVTLPAFTKNALGAELHAHYQQPFPTPDARRTPWVFARDLVEADDWYASLLDRRDVLRSIPALLLLGEQDPGFGTEALERWQRLFETVETYTFPEVGHQPQEEVAGDVRDALSSFLRLG